MLELDSGELAMIKLVTSTEVSKPIKPFLETSVSDPQLASIQIHEQTSECHLSSDSLYIRLRVATLLDEVVALLEESAEILKSLRGGHVDDTTLTEFNAKLLAVCEESLQYYRGSWWYKRAKKRSLNLLRGFGLLVQAEPKLTFSSMEYLTYRPIWDSSE
ncbi:unnamed protein product [Cylicocyclus nassatus]|uniref:Elongation factor-like GTPase 1 domain-containing protein n=1 Tax=Cylicocyclus nassatus TaxID=53992 RepID=A0AA36M3B9_CYLNA|nr:unnamed protein product [Cylicocyclus nassatus]